MKHKLQTWKQLEQCAIAQYRAIEKTAWLEKRPLTESEAWSYKAARQDVARYRRYQAVGIPNPNGMPL